MLQSALGIMMICSGNYYHGEMTMMSFHVSVQRGVCRMLLAPRCRLAGAPSHPATGISRLFGMHPCHIGWPPTPLHPTSTELALKLKQL